MTPGTIRWVGVDAIHDDPTVYAMALDEESVLDVAFLHEGQRRLSRSAAVACTSRLAQRVALATTGLNPEWEPWHFRPGVVKAPASTLNQGVRFFLPLDTMPAVSRLAAHVPELARLGVVEAFIAGDAWELDGFVIEGEISFFKPMRQWWTPDWAKIVGYERDRAPVDLYLAAQKAIWAVGLDNSPFCIELRHAAGRWYVIEIHARLGEDDEKGLLAVMCDRNPYQVIEEAAAARAAKAAA